MIIKFSLAKLLAILVVVQSMPLTALALAANPHRTKKILSAPIYDKALQTVPVAPTHNTMFEKESGAEFTSTSDMIRKIKKTSGEAEKEQLIDLFCAALNSSQDIHSVIQHLMPSNDPRHSTAVRIKMLSIAFTETLYGEGNNKSRNLAVGDFWDDRYPHATLLLTNRPVGADLVMSVLNQNINSSSTLKKNSVTETEAVMLDTMIRSVLNRTNNAYQNYKTIVKRNTNSGSALEKLQERIDGTSNSQDVTEKVSTEYLMRKARREIAALKEDAFNGESDALMAREALVALAGAEAVDNLDKQFKLEGIDLAASRNVKDSIPVRSPL